MKRRPRQEEESVSCRVRYSDPAAAASARLHRAIDRYGSTCWGLSNGRDDLATWGGLGVDSS